jgi:hypothetical protein
MFFQSIIHVTTYLSVMTKIYFQTLKNKMARRDDADLYRTTFKAVEQNLSNFLHEVQTQSASIAEAPADFSRDKLWENITASAQKVGTIV